MDKIVAALPYRDHIIVITEQGVVYRLTIGVYGYESMVECLLTIELRPR